MQNGITITGEHGSGLNQLAFPNGIYVDYDDTIYVADTRNHRIIEWKKNEKEGIIAAGGKGQGNGNDQLNEPRNVIIDQENDFLIICDRGNRRVLRYSRQNSSVSETIISSILCYDLFMDKNGYLYVSDDEKHEVRKWNNSCRWKWTRC